MKAVSRLSENKNYIIMGVNSITNRLNEMETRHKNKKLYITF